ISSRSDIEERLRVVPLPEFLLELLALVNDELAVVAEADGPALERARGGAFEVDAGDVEAGAVARALELGGRFEPVGRAAQVRAGGAQRVDLALVTDDPEVLVLEAIHDLAVFEALGRADLDLAGRLGEDVGEHEAEGAEGHAGHRGSEGGPGQAER